MKNIIEVIQSETRNYPGKLGLVDGQRTVRYGDLFHRVNWVSEKLKELCITTGNRVAIVCEDSIDYVILSLAVLKISAVIVPIPVGSSKKEIESVIREIKIEYLIYEKGAYASNRARHLAHMRGLEKDVFLLSCPSSGRPPQEIAAINPAFIRFSSGTTGARKGVVISHEAIIQRTEAADKGLKVTRNDTILWVLSMSFHYVVTILLFLRRGATIILAGRVFPEGMLVVLEKHRPSLIYASPLHYHLLTQLRSVPRKAFGNVRIAVSTAVRLPLEIAKMFRDKFGFELSEAYGIIEVGLPFINTSQSISRRGSVGRILPDYRIKVINQESTSIGEICLKGKGLFSAYFSPWKNAKQILKGGWFHTGDIGKIDKDGFLYLLGRIKDVINFNGMKIFPQEVEAVLNSHQLVKESLVYGLSHPEYGSLPVADLVVRHGHKGGFDVEELRVYCYRHLAKYKVPKEFRLLERLEKTASGKLKRKHLQS